MIDLRDLPFKGKRQTNTYIQCLAVSMILCAWIAGVVLWHPWFYFLTLTMAGCGCIAWLGWGIYKDIRKEWS